MGFYYYDSLGYIFVIIGAIIALAAEFYVNNRFSKYKNIKNKSGLTGVEVARRILDEAGLNDVYVTEVDGILSDHYDPNRKVVRLSHDIFHGNTIASSSVAAHECGHAIQDKENYFLIRLRGYIFPFVNLVSRFGYVAIFIGFIFNIIDLVWGGIGLLLVILLFQLITIPVELDASNRAKRFLQDYKLLSKNEIEGTNDMLKAAAYTYVASLVTTILEILRLIVIAGRKDDR